MTENKALCPRPLKWLFSIRLLCCLLIPMGLLVIGYFPLSTWYSWLSIPARVATIVCLICLSGRYRLSGIAEALAFLLPIVWPRILHSLLIPLLDVRNNIALIQGLTTFFSRTASLLGILAVILECTAHARTAPSEKRKWYFFLAGAIASTVLSLIIVAVTQSQLQDLTGTQIRLWNDCATLFKLAADVLYLVFLHQTIRTLEKE